MKFSYLAKDNDGKITKGTLDASNQKDAEEALEKEGLTPISVTSESQKGKLASKISDATTLISVKDKMLFARQLSTLVSAGIPITQALQTLESQTANKKLKGIIGEVAKDVEGGTALSVAMGKYKKLFSSLAINMIKSGEVGGTLDEALERIANELEVEHKMVSQIRGALVYPIAVLILTFGVVIFMIVWLIPQFTAIFASLGGDLPPSMKFLIGFSNFVKYWGIFVLLGIIALVFAIRKTLQKSQKLRTIWHRIILRLPAIGAAAQKINISRFTRTLSSLLTSGVAVLESLQVAVDALENEVYKAELTKAIEKVKNGSTIADALKGSKYFPEIVTQTIAVGEETGSTDKILMKLTEFYEDEVSNFTKGISDLMLPVIMIIIGAVVGLLFYTVIVPISQMGESIK